MVMPGNMGNNQGSPHSGFPNQGAATGSPLQPAYSNAPNNSTRPALRRVLQVGLFVVACLAAFVLIADQLNDRFGAVTLGYALLAALVPLVIVVPTFLWLDRYEAEPRRYLAAAFAWGALISVVFAFVLNTLGVKALVANGFNAPVTTAAIVIGPVVEESFKGLGVLLIFLLRRKEFDGIIDGLVYAGLIGAGFAFTENILYLSNAYAAGGSELMQQVFVLRGIASPFAHPMFTACTGIAIGIAVSTRSVVARWIAIPIGWACAVLLHAIWNLSATVAANGIFWIYFGVMVPLFVAFVALLFVLRRREGRLIRTNLHPYADAGWISYPEVMMLGSLSERRRARDWAFGAGGSIGKRNMRAFQDEASDLALLRARIVRGSAEKGAFQRELELLHAMSAHRRGFIGTPVG